MSKEEETRDEFFEYLMALNAIGSDANFLSQVEPLDPPLEMEDRLEELEKAVNRLSNFVHVLQRGPKGDKGEDGADFDLTKEDIKNAVKDGVIEGLKELLSEKI